MSEPSPELVRAVLADLKKVCRGELSEVRVAKAHGSVRVFRTQSEKFGNLKPEKA